MSKKNGFEVKSKKSRNPEIKKLCTPIVIFLILIFAFEISANKKLNMVNIKIHIKRLPSWFPQAPENLYIIGFSECELK